MSRALSFIIACTVAVGGCIGYARCLDTINGAYEGDSIGEFKLTAYCGCKKCCGKWAENRPVDEDGNEIVVGATGKRLTAGYSIAVDPKVIPYGTEVIIDGHTYKAMDCGVKGKHIDIYFDDHEEARRFGVQHAEVYIAE